MSVSYRANKESDMNFIYATFLKSYRFSNPIARAQPKFDYYRNGSNELRRLFADKVNTIVACDENDQDLIIGFLIHKENIIYYTYTKAAFRGNGVARGMLKAANLLEDATYRFTHFTSDVLRLNLLDKFKLIYNPYLFSWGESYEGAR